MKERPGTWNGRPKKALTKPAESVTISEQMMQICEENGRLVAEIRQISPLFGGEFGPSAALHPLRRGFFCSPPRAAARQHPTPRCGDIPPRRCRPSARGPAAAGRAQLRRRAKGTEPSRHGVMDKAACDPQQRRAGNKTRAEEQRAGPAGPAGIYGAGARGALSRGHARTDLKASAAPSAPRDPPGRGEPIGEPPTISAPHNPGR